MVWVVVTLRKTHSGARKWDKAEPGIVRQIEAATGQRVEFRQKFNASRTPDFTHTSIFWVWLAFTRDCLVLVHPEEIGRSGTAHLFVTPRRDASIRRLGRRLAELTLMPPDPGEPATVVLLIRPCDYEMLTKWLGDNLRRSDFNVKRFFPLAE